MRADALAGAELERAALVDGAARAPVRAQKRGEAAVAGRLAVRCRHVGGKAC